MAEMVSMVSSDEDEPLSVVDGIPSGNYLLPVMEAVPKEWSSYSPAMLRRPKNPLLVGSSIGKDSSSRRRPSSFTSKLPTMSASKSNFSALAETKIELAKLQIMLAQKEFDAQQKRLDAEESRRQAEFEASQKLAAANEERQRVLFLLEKAILEARLKSLMEN